MSDDAKIRAAERAVEIVGDNQVVGLGTGSTAKYAIEGLGRRASAGFAIRGVPTSIATAKLAREVGIPLLDLNEADRIDITIDGADEIDPAFHMIKGGGGALTREKLVALNSNRRVIIVDGSKLVDKLGLERALPVEVLPFAWTKALRLLEKLGCVATLRRAASDPFLTDNGNYIADCQFNGIDDPPELERQIKLLPGVVECGLFISIADTVIVGYSDHTEIRERK